ncbi:hypothetical protein T492DRAFT_855366 [Pavlovales sp. CCMP2436]|nr:hypothetical protein T492DRAFT_855366 [Pavlovales sp. CCMP2436]
MRPSIFVALAGALAPAHGWRAPASARGQPITCRSSTVLATSAPSPPRTLSDCERTLRTLYAKPVYPPYSGVVEEMFSSLVLTLADSRFEYSRLFALGLYTIISQALVKPPSLALGVATRATNVELASAVCAALELKWEIIERDGIGMRDWAAGLSEAQLFAIASGEPLPDPAAIWWPSKIRPI